MIIIDEDLVTIYFAISCHQMIEHILLNTGISTSICRKIEISLAACLETIDKPTALCLLMREEKSDKGSGINGRHNYTLLYSSLFEEMRLSLTNLLEVGLGTNFTDIPSSMGPTGTPGASLRGWKRFFNNARIYGADIDKRILFEEERISTFFIDQLSPGIIQQSLDHFPAQYFDVILDDGLHTYEANSILHANAHHLVKNGGIYIIEDINSSRGNISRYISYLSELDQPAILIQLPHSTNSSDNCIALIQY